MNPNEQDDLLVFDDDEHTDIAERQHPWRILLVDDEPDVHAATLFALKDTLIAERPLHFEHAYSASEAKQMLQQPNEFAVAIIDVVMEASDAGLQLVQYIRETAGNDELRIILRTGQPGYAPEIETIKQYDINDYKTKAELTKVRLYTSLTLAIRSYAQIKQLHVSRRGLVQVLKSTRELGKPTGLQTFAAGVVTQLCALLQVEEEGLICAAQDNQDATPYVLAAGGHFAPYVGMPLDAIPETHVLLQMSTSLRERRACHEQGVSLFFSGEENKAFAAYVDLTRPLDEIEVGLLDIFCSNISVAFANIQLHQSVSELAYTDELLKLPNRNALQVQLGQSSSDSHILALLDIDDFANINALLDDAFGDNVLKVVAERLKSSFSDAVHLYRVGADVFGLYGPANALDIAHIQTLFSTPFQIEDYDPLRLTATIGWLEITDPHMSAAELLKNAGSALKQAKEFKRGQAMLYQKNLADDARERIRLLNDLRLAFSNSGLHLQYQPFIHLSTGTIVGAEALLRWRKDDGSLVPPDRFIALAEQSGFIIPLGNWVIRSALQWRASLVGKVPESFRIAINISHEQFEEQDFEQQLQEAMAELGLQPQQIELELTESVASDNIELAARKIRALQSSGFGIAIDDFGTGFSSLSVLQQLPADRLKIDRSFVSGSAAQQSGLAFAHTILTLAKQLKLHTIAEGIESEQQRHELQAAGCEEGQGYHFAKPLTEDEFLTLLNNGHQV